MVRATRAGADDAVPGEGGQVPQQPQVLPQVDWAAERDSGHVWNAISLLREEAGGLKAAVQQSTSTVNELRSDIRDFSKDIAALQQDTSKQAGFVKGVAWAFGIGFIAISVILGVAWTSVIKPGLAYAIVEQIKPEIAKQVQEAVPKPQPPAGRRP